MSGSLERALHILVELGSGPASISELGRKLDVHRTTSLRLLRTLEDERFVTRSEDGRYRLGPRMATLAGAALDGFDLRAIASPHIRALGAACGHTVHLGAIEGNEIVYLDKVDSSHAIRMHSRIGARAPLHATGVGKALLAHLAPEERQRLLGEPPYRRCTPNTTTSLEELEKELEGIAAQGWAHDDFEHEEFIHCVAAPVCTASGAATAAVSISVPRMVLDTDGLLALVGDLMHTAGAISEELGWNPP